MHIMSLAEQVKWRNQLTLFCAASANNVLTRVVNGPNASRAVGREDCIMIGNDNRSRDVSRDVRILW